ncbi:MAG: type II toxin-antitoxin system HicA family toxin [Phycisphaerales bacterium]|nr:MAG: type II toxin-antitoxin system HicA family toxin [Phycisphaerales bacterium]
MKLPRNVTGRQLTSALNTLGYEVTRQRGSHIHLITQLSGEHHLVIPDHRPLKPGMLNRLLKDVAEHHGMSRDELIEKLRL